jgi:hypothetical protein
VTQRIPGETTRAGAKQGRPLIGLLVAGHQIAPDRPPTAAPR